MNLVNGQGMADRGTDSESIGFVVSQMELWSLK